uniref:Uncharacterized protein n=1 Tax=Triticum urartu TaxID=4572 RepID=A0A8R7V020_TRIUA
TTTTPAPGAPSLDHLNGLLPPRRPVVPVDLLNPAAPIPTPHHTETDAAATQYDYGVDVHSLLPEQPDVGAQEPDATFDDDSYYTGGAYYY